MGSRIVPEAIGCQGRQDDEQDYELDPLAHLARLRVASERNVGVEGIR